MEQNQGRSVSKAVIHCDVDCFYCQVEVKDAPTLANRPLAVHQGNSGGFVAVNYEARAAGIQCGDGSDPHNLAARTFQRPDNKSLQEARELCPGLVTKPMRSDRYRQVSAQVLALISQHATNGECEKTSYDDFYIEVVPDGASLRTAETWMPSADHIVHVIGGTSFGALPAVLKCAVQTACNIKAAVRKELSLTMSFGVATGKLTARLAGPLRKPSGMTVVPPNQAAAFLSGTPILKVPQLRGQVGKQVVDQLSVEYVRELAAFEAKELVGMFGTVTGQLLFDLGHCIDNKRVQAKGPQQSICCTKSYHGLREHARVDEALQRLVFALWPRLLEERSNSGRIPAKLKLSCKQGGREQPTRSYSLPFPQAAQSLLRATVLGSVDPAVTQSSAVHTLIPNLAPRSRLQQQGLSISSRSSRAHGAPDTVGLTRPLSQLQLPGPEDFGREAESSDQNAEQLLESGAHQAARQAIFQAAMSLLKPKLAEPVLVNFMSVAGEYARDMPHASVDKRGPMSRFVQKEAAAQSCTPITFEATRSSLDSKMLGQSHSSTVKNGVPRKQQRSEAATSNFVKLPRKGIGPMDRFLK
ncbi:hypothetical protein ABBQ38_009904 [Trebouxia sp. C0009 RCD-2024]